MNGTDKIVDQFTTHAIGLERVSAGMRKKVLRMLDTLETDLVRDLANPANLTPHKQARLSALLSQTRGTIQKGYSAIKSAHTRDLFDLAEMEAMATTKLVNKAIGVDVLTTALSPKTLETLADKTLIHGATSKEWWGRQAGDTVKRFSDQMRQGVLRGETVDELARRVRGTKAANFTDGIMQASKREADALVRSSVQVVSNESRLATYKANEDVVKGIEWVSTLDTRTTDICKALDGLQWDNDRNPVGHDKKFPGPTAHWNCRSTQVSVLRSWEELAGPKSTFKEKHGPPREVFESRLRANGVPEDKIPGVLRNARASMDGEVSAGLNFDAWLKTKTPEFQTQLLGPGRAQLWKEGKITMRDLIDQHDRPLTIAQLRQHIAAGEAIAAIPPPAAGEHGLSLLERGLLEESMVHGVEQREVLTSFVDTATGQRVSFRGLSPSADTLEKAKTFKGVTVLRNTLDAGGTFTADELKLWTGFRFEKAVVVGSNGRLHRITRLKKKAFGPAQADAITAKLDALKDHPKIQAAANKLATAIRAEGTLRFATEKPGAITLRTKHFLQRFSDQKAQIRPFSEPGRAARAAETARKASTAGNREFPPLTEIKVLKELPGSTRPKLVEDIVTGKRFVMKDSRNTSAAHLREEVLADNLYRKMGLDVPKAIIVETDAGPVKLAEFIDGGQTMKNFLATASKAEIEEVLAEVRKGFIADSLLANWDVAGLDLDNLLVAGKKVWRIDNGGALRFRAQGAAKGQAFGATVTELQTLRDASLNRSTARVFEGLTPAQISEQIEEVLKKRDEILKATPAELRPTIEARLNWLEGQLDPVTEELAKQVRDSRILGRSILGDRDLIEDLQQLYWQQVDATGATVTRAQLKLTPKGSDIVMRRLFPEIDLDKPKFLQANPSAPADVHPKDTFWPQLQAALKTVNHHATDGQYNQATLAAAKATKAQLEELAGQADTAAMAKHYLGILDEIDKAIANKATTPKFDRFKHKPPPQKPDLGKTGPEVPSRPAGITIESEGGQIRYQINKLDRGNATQTTELALDRSSVRGEFYELDLDGVKVRFFPYRGKTVEQVPFAYRGRMEIVAPGEATAENIRRVNGVIRTLGIDNAPATPEFQELLYLHRSAYIRKFDQDSAYREIFGADISDGEKVAKIKAYFRGKKIDPDKAKRYDPHGTANPFGDGYRTHYRWDLTPEEVEKEMAGYTLFHQSGSYPLHSLVDDILSGGGETISTMERLRKGVFVASESRQVGMSPIEDMGTGGANYFFTRIRRDRRGSGLHFKIRNLARQDAISYPADKYGNTTSAAEIQEYRGTAPKAWKDFAGRENNETMFKNSLQFLTEIEEIKAPTATERTKIIEAFKKHGITKLPDGRNVEDIVK